MKSSVRTEIDALAYLTECTLATVADMALKKSRPKGEFARQISIAQSGIDWLREFHYNNSTTRVKEVLNIGYVKKWAEKYMPECKND